MELRINSGTKSLILNVTDNRSITLKTKTHDPKRELYLKSFVRVLSFE